MASYTYSFLNISATLVSEVGVIDLGYNASVAEEGISFEMEGDKNTLTMGAGADGMHNLHAQNNGIVTVRLLKTAIANSLLMALYDAQTLLPALWGTNVILVRDPNRGDLGSARACAFKRKPNIAWARDGGMIEWRWDSIYMDTVLGLGLPSIS